jgi:ABC-type transport system substrate-binding protein
MSGADLSLLRADTRWQPYGAPDSELQVNGDAMNARIPPFDNVEVRRAVAAALDRDHYRLIRPSNMSPASQPIPPDVPGYSASVAGQKHDYAAALEHMRRAGYAYDPKTGKGGYPKPIPYVTSQGTLGEYVAQISQQELAKIGLRLEIRLLSWPAYIAVTHKPDGAAMSFQQWTADYPDAVALLEGAFSGADSEDSNDTAFYSSEALDDRLKRSREELDPAKRQRLVDEATQIVCDDAPWAFSFYWHGYEVKQPYVRGYRRHPVWTAYVRDAWVDRARAVASQTAGAFERALGAVVPAPSRGAPR